jgi:hypothetical protein
LCHVPVIQIPNVMQIRSVYLQMNMWMDKQVILRSLCKERVRLTFQSTILRCET